MQQVVIENPVINSPFAEPKRHFRFTEQGITDEIVKGRRVSSYFIPIPRAKKKNPKQMAFETEWTADRIEENKLISKIRERVSGYPEGTLFRWVISDFSLIDAIESGIVKVPRVPVADDSMVGEQPTYRDLWSLIREGLPKKGRGTDHLADEPTLPAELEGALQSLYSNYEKYFKQWQQNAEARAKDLTPPVFIVVCNNTSVSKLVFDYVAGWEKNLPDESTVLVPGRLSLFSNVDGDRWSARPNSILIDSEQLESGEGMSPEFKKIAAREIEEFRAEYRERFPGRDLDSLTEEDLLREVMNTVGKHGKLGEHIRCVVSVSMLTEGWDANTVTHILGVRAFGTQLLCEQVVGRGLRRMSYAVNEGGLFEPEYAEVYGVPFSFIPCSGSTQDPKPGPTPTHVRALEDRRAGEITFPRVIGYRAIVTSTAGEKMLKPILRPYDTVGSTRYVDFDTTRNTYSTRADKCHISHVVADTESWEQKMAQTLEDMDEVVCYVKNQNLGFTIPYTLAGEERHSIPDFILRLDDGQGHDDLLNLIVEVSGEARKDKAAKVATARSLWVPAINNHGGFGRWGFVEISDPWDAKNTIRGALASPTTR